MTVYAWIAKKAARFFYFFVKACVLCVHKELKTNFDEFWLLIERHFSGEVQERFESESREMIEGVYELREQRVREIMVPRNELVTVRVSDSIDRVIALIQTEGRSRIPVFEDKIDNIVGIVYAKDLLKHLAINQNKDIPLEKIMRPAYFVPETKNVFDLLQEMKKKKVHVAIVIDEYGGTAGLVTMEDLIEEIIGEVQDEYDNEEEPIVPAGEDTWLVAAWLGIDDVNEKLGLAIPVHEDYDTVAGFLMYKLGRIPKLKERIDLDTLTFVIVESDEKSIGTVKIIKQQRPADAGRASEKSEDGHE